MQLPFVVPDDLAASLREGRCIAFVGAGFSAPSVPGWKDLLAALTQHVPDPEAKADLGRWLVAATSARDWEGIAAALERALGAGFSAALQQAIPSTPKEPTQARLRLLRGIPFHYVLTTNFDDYLGATRTPCTETYADVASAPRRSWWDEHYWRADSAERSMWADRVVALHGKRTGEALVFTTRAYRERLYKDPAYKSFLRTLFATHNVLYLGFSFSDAYINEIRSEILAMLGVEGQARRLQDFAILEDVSPQAVVHFKAEEGLTALPFSTRDSAGQLGRRFDGFDRWLEAIHARTNPAAELRRTIRGQRILWLDPNRGNNDYGVRTLAEQAGDDLVQVETVAAAAAELARAEQADAGFSLIITRFGYRGAGDADALALLRQLDAPRPPVIVFASGEHRRQNRELSLRHGALAYADTWSELFEIVSDRFGDARRR